MVGVLVGVAEGGVTLEEVEETFTNPHFSNYPKKANPVPASGLYLQKVEYPEHVLQPDFYVEGKLELSDRAKSLADIKQLIYMSNSGLSRLSGPHMSAYSCGLWHNLLSMIYATGRAKALRDDVEAPILEVKMDRLKMGNEKLPVRLGGEKESVTDDERGNHKVDVQTVENEKTSLKVDDYEKINVIKIEDKKNCFQRMEENEHSKNENIVIKTNLIEAQENMNTSKIVTNEDSFARPSSEEEETSRSEEDPKDVCSADQSPQSPDYNVRAQAMRDIRDLLEQRHEVDERLRELFKSLTLASSEGESESEHFGDDLIEAIKGEIAGQRLIDVRERVDKIISKKQKVNKLLRKNWFQELKCGKI